jgi:hypothetical protein
MATSFPLRHGKSSSKGFSSLIKATGVIEDITGEGFVAVIRILSSDGEELGGERIKIDQEELETVLPQVSCSQSLL